jgi:uncharacterized membrane protein
MAGIGFELQKILKEGGLSGFFKVALAGIIIVAGPWILSIIGIFLIGRFAGFVLAEGRSLFMGVIIYSYAFSLFIFGGTHYVFTRMVADIIYLEERREAGAALVLFAVLIAALSLPLSLVAAARLNAGALPALIHPGLFRLGAVLFFTVINLTWLLMIFISLSKRYLAIFLIFLAGISASVAGVVGLGSQLGLGGAMIGFAGGQCLTTLLLFVLSLLECPPGRFISAIRRLAAYFPRYRYLFLTGLFYYWGIWIDKIVFWFACGTPVPGTFIRLFDAYDIPVYLANLTMIPGLVYFIVVAETNFYVRLKNFLLALSHGRLGIILEQKARLRTEMRTSLGEQSLFQGVLTAFLLLIAPALCAALFADSVNSGILRLTLTAVFFHLLFLTTLTLLFYLEMYARAFLASVLFFAVNLAGSVLTVRLSGNLFGLSYLIAGCTASMAAMVFLHQDLKRIERLIYARYSSD